MWYNWNKPIFVIIVATNMIFHNIKKNFGRGDCSPISTPPPLDITGYGAVFPVQWADETSE